MYEKPKGIDVTRQKVSNYFKMHHEKGNSSLHFVVQSDYVELAKQLIAVGCDVNAKNEKGEPPLVMAIRENQIEMVKILLSAGAICNNDYFPREQGPLHYAASYGCPEIVRLLIEHGVDVHACDGWQRTPLHFSNMCRNENKQDHHLKVTKMLIAAGADINAIDKADTTPLLVTIQFKFLAAFEFLLSSGADFNTGEYNVFYYIREAVEVDSFDIFKCLIELGNDINMKDGGGISLLHIAAEMFSVKIMEFMLNNNALISVDDDGIDPLCYALNGWGVYYANRSESTTDDFDQVIEKYENNQSVYSRQMECINLLIKHGVNLNAVTNDGRTSLNILLENYKTLHSNFLRFLLKNGATFEFEHPSVREVMKNSNGSKFPHLLLRHTALFEAQNRTDGPANFDVNKLNNKSREDYTRCRDELQLMKSTKITDTNVSFFNVLADQDIGPYACNESIISEFEELNISESFPIYCDLLYDRFTEEVKFQKLVEQARDSLARIMNWDSESMLTPLSEIIRYLDKLDLSSLAKV